MIQQIVDLHIHSKYARACSKELELSKIAKACEQKGIDIVSTGDFTHPMWFASIQSELEEVGESGLFRLKDKSSPTKFMLGTEISVVYKHKDATRRLHLLIYAPSFDGASAFIKALEERGANLKADGRPIIGMPAKEILKICLAIDKQMMVIPAHAWTPWFAVFGSKSGYNALEECFEELTPEIFAIETGLSSDPPMNHRLSALDTIALISNSDAHSLDNLGREANVLAFENEKEIAYNEIRQILKTRDPEKFLYTIEFYPEEGMYHFDGHRECEVRLTPTESKANKDICPECKKKLTIGVLHRVDDLADQPEGRAGKRFIPHRSIVPLREIIAAAYEVGKGSKKVAAAYEQILKGLGSEFYILLSAPIEAIRRVAPDPAIATGVERMRNGLVKADPGYDGVYGTVDVFSDARPLRPRQTYLL